MSTTPVGWAQPDPRLLARSPLVNVLWQVRFTALPELADGRTALKLQERIGRDTNLTPLNAPQVAVQVAGPAAFPPPVVEQGGQGWRLSAPDGSTHVAINPTSLSVETTQYGGWTAHFRPWVEATTSALAAVVDPGVVLRVGMRYVNAIFAVAVGKSSFESAASTSEVLVPALRGFLDDASYGPLVDSYQGRHMLKLRDDLLSHIQHGVVATEAGEFGLLLDIDTYSERTHAFDSGAVLSLSDSLHEAGLSVFQRCVDEESWNSMGPESVERSL